MSNLVIEMKNINREFKMGSNLLTVLKGVNLKVRKGEFLSVMGSSGSGKSTLLNIIGCLDKASFGSYFLNGNCIDELNDDELSLMRNKELGFVFQTFNLIPYYTALKNVEAPLSYRNDKNRKQIAIDLLTRVGLGERLYHKPSEMSGGERQRIAIARALSTEPSILLADEPTGALDSKSGKDIMSLFQELHNEGKTVIMVTHDKEVAQHADRIIVFKDGVIVDELN